MIARMDNLKIITLSGVFIMSLGLFLASFCTHVSRLRFGNTTGSQYADGAHTSSAVAVIPYPSSNVWDRKFHVLFPHYEYHPCLF